jgi:uncharacterized protein YoxC
MSHRWRLAGGEWGQASFSVVATLAAVLLAGVLVNRVAWTAESINKKAERIARTATPINEATDAVLNLDRTNELGSSILATAEPLQGKLAEIVRLAQSVDGLAISINNSATTVDGVAKSINSDAVGILQTARSIDQGVKTIIAGLNTTLGIVTSVLTQAQTAHRLAACIDQGLIGTSAPDNHCR